MTERGNKLKKQILKEGLAGICRGGKEKKGGWWKREMQHRVLSCCVSFSPLLQRDPVPDGFSIRCSGG